MVDNSCMSCGQQGGRDGCGFRPAPGRGAGHWTRSLCRFCENEKRKESRKRSKAAPIAMPAPSAMPPRSDFVEEEDTHSEYANPEVELDRFKLYAIISDIHVPYQCERANGAFCNLLADIKVDGLIINGDFLDLIELSKHARGSVAELEGLRVKDTFDAGNKQLDIYQQAAGSSCKEFRFIEGNHETRVDRWMHSGDNSVWIDDEATDIAKRLRFAERGFIFHKGYPEAHVKLGHLLVTHGKLCSKYAAAAHMNAYNHSVITGHGHSPQAIYASGIDGLQRAGYMTGHMANDRSRALRYAKKPNAQRQGFATVGVEPNGNFHVELVNLVDKKFLYGGRMYG